MNLQETLYFVHVVRNTLRFGQKQFLTPIKTCPYCGTLLKISDGNVKYVRPDA